MAIVEVQPLLALCSVLFAGGAALILVWFLVRRPPLTVPVKLALLAGFGVLPLGAAATTNIAGFEHTTRRSFCGSCHVMTPYTEDVDNPLSLTLAARHGRNEAFGEHNCYECHRDYGAFSTLLTKWGGMLHVWEYYTEFHRYGLGEARDRITLYKPYVNQACTRCHSTLVPGFADVPDHNGPLERLRAGEVSCVSQGCHGPAHPFSKSGKVHQVAEGGLRSSGAGEGGR